MEDIDRDNSQVCVLCNEKFTGWGHNPEPLFQSGVCCKDCDDDKVIPARIEEYNNGKRGV